MPKLNRCRNCGNLLAIGDECGICKKLRQDQKLHYERVRADNERLKEQILDILVKNGVTSVSKKDILTI